MRIRCMNHERRGARSWARVSAIPISICVSEMDLKVRVGQILLKNSAIGAVKVGRLQGDL